MTDRFLVLGSVLTKGSLAADIDLVAAEFHDPTGRYFLDDGSGRLTLQRYEELARETGKPIDLFFTAEPSTFNLSAQYDPHAECPRWEFHWAFCGKFFFLDDLCPMTHADLIALVTPATVTHLRPCSTDRAPGGGGSVVDFKGKS
jgi:hypothetical protein